MPTAGGDLTPVGSWRRLGRGAALGLCVAVAARLFEEALGSFPPWLIGTLALAPFWLALLWVLVGNKREVSTSPRKRWVEGLGWAGLTLYAAFLVFFTRWTIPLPG